MSRVSCIEHPAGDLFVILRRDYMALCDDDACAAMLLHVFEHWTNTKLREREERGRGDEWIFRSREDLRGDDLCCAFGLDRLDQAIDHLHRRGYIDRRNNPRHPWDRKLQYRFKIEEVQQAINRLNMHSGKSENRRSDNRASKDGNPRIEVGESEEQYKRLGKTDSSSITPASTQTGRGKEVLDDEKNDSSPPGRFDYKLNAFSTSNNGHVGERAA
jgi:hypothetical protein